MRHKLSLLAVLVGVFLVALGATLVWSGRSDNASAANPTPTVIATISVGQYPSFVAANATTNRIYVASNGSEDVSVIDGATDTLKDTVDIPAPFGVAVNAAANRVYVAEHTGKLAEIDGSTSTLVGEADLVDAVWSYDVAFNPNTGCVYVTNQASGNVSVVNCATSGTITVGSEPLGVAVNPNTNRVYVANVSTTTYRGAVTVINGATNAIVADIDVEPRPYDIEVDSSTNRVYVTQPATDSVLTINGATNNVIDTVGVGDEPVGIDVNRATHRVYVTNQGGDSVSIIDGATGEVVATVQVGDGPYAVGANSTTGRAYVANSSAASVSVIQDFPISPVGGVAEPPQLEPEAMSSGHSSSKANALAVAGAIAGGALLLAAGAWGMRRRRAG